jgi:hypothetical protein
LLLISTYKLDLKGKDDIKQAGGVEFVLDALKSKGTMLAYVKQKWIKGNGYVSLLIPDKRAGYLEEVEE